MENYNRIKKYKSRTCYYLNNKLHRLDGPAIEWNNGDKFWYQNNLLHRLDGPAIEWNIEWNIGNKEWYYEGKEINCKSQEEFERYIKLRLFW
jgi:hypothetical protein